MEAQRSPELSLEISDKYPVDDGRIRTGTIWTCISHIIAAVIGVGVLSLAWSIAQLGWIAGPICILFFGFMTYVSAHLLSECYRSQDPMNGGRNYSYMDAVRGALGRKNIWLCGFLQYLSLFGVSAAYVVTSATCIKAIYRSNCYHKNGNSASCSFENKIVMFMFGFAQILLSQFPDFSSIEWLSIVASIMSFTYCFVGFGLGLAKVIGNGVIKGQVGGIYVSSTAQKVWRISQAIGDIAFSFPYSIIVIEIQDTLRSPPSEEKTMKKASKVSVFIITLFYLCCGGFGYAAFGNGTPGNLLTGFGFYEPYWIVDFGNACIILHLLATYQIYSQPIFAFVERYFSEQFPSNRFVMNYHTIHLWFIPPYRMNLFRLCFRVIYVVLTVSIAMAFPYFNQVLAFLGAISFWPLTIYFPVEIYSVQKKVSPWTSSWFFLKGFNLVGLLLSLFALIGSIEGIFAERFS